MLTMPTEENTETPRLSRDLLASQLGVSRLTLNRQLMRWTRSGLLSVGYGKVQFIDRGVLERIALDGFDWNVNKRPHASSK
ncbi:helix-turn-helix domain-containing protein [Stenotrophomonas maltophilia]|uniref:helix-turn-helix domain-containing protein n=1 Tax=Stenotrophomonas maltophilia TaxID=40324 RepID=UPI003CE5AA14